MRDPSRAADVRRQAAEPVGPAGAGDVPAMPAVSTSAFLAAIESALDDAIISGNRHGVITSWSLAAERLFGYHPGEAVGCSMRMIVPRDRYDEHDEALARAVRGEQVSCRETRRLTKSGDELALSFRMSPVLTDEGDVAGVLMIAHDIRQRKHGEREAFRKGAIAGASTVARDITDQKRAVEEATEANRQKDEFLAVLSHELRTPLNAIMGWADMLVGTNMDEASTSRALASIQRNARVQAQLIEDLLDISRIVAGKLTLNREHVDLAVVIGAAIEDLRPEIDAKHIDLRATVGPDANAVTGDAPRLQQVVSNLLSNAIKFTPSGGRIDVALERLDDRAQITVRDSGQGIAPELLAHVFDRFRQGDSSATRRHGGLGLGLGIVKHLVEAHGGAVSASSEGLGKGSVFTARLPLRASTAPTVHRSGDTDAPSPRALSNVRALIVDDDRDAADLLLFALERSGAQAKAVTSAAEALTAIAHDTFDVILADIGMPDVDGHDLVRAIRSDEGRSGGPSIAAVAITAHAGPGDRDRALLAGFDWHLTKPVEPREVISVVARMTRQSKKVP